MHRFKKDILYIILLFFWISLFLRFFYRQIKFLDSIVTLYACSEDEKNEIIDGEFYKFMKLCTDTIPKDSDIGFEVKPNDLLMYSEDWYIKEYYIQRCPYYLFPREVFRSEYVKNINIDYRIVYDPKLKVFYLYHKDKFISNVTD